MSADNYAAVRPYDDPNLGTVFVVTMESASQDVPRPLIQNDDGSFQGGYTKAFTLWTAASEYAHSMETEYGVSDYCGLSESDLHQMERDGFVDALRWARQDAEYWSSRAYEVEERLRELSKSPQVT